MKFRFTIGRKIGLGFGVLIFLTLIAFIVTQSTLSKSRSITDKVTSVYTPSVSILEEFNLLILRSKMLISNWVYVHGISEDKDKLKKLIDEEYPDLKKRIFNLSGGWGLDEKNAIMEIFGLTDSLLVLHRDIMSQLNSFSNYEEPAIFFVMRDRVEGGEVSIQTNTILNKLSTLIYQQQENANVATHRMLDSFQVLQNVVISVGLTLIVGGILIAFFTVRTIVKPIQELKRMLLLMGKGILPAENIEGRNDEIGEMSVALNGLIDGLTRTTEFAYEVGSGNFLSNYQPLSEEDTLGRALLKMRQDLRENERVLEAKVIERTEEVVRQKEEIEFKNKELEVLYKQVTDSIKYAKRIQEAILPPDTLVRRLLPNSFVLYKPKDIVSGDFYWIHEKDDKVLFAAVDCTGHGVPGAFMSIVAYNLLKHVMTNTRTLEPAAILDELNERVSETLHQTSEVSSTKDGMDLAFCVLDYRTMELEYAGAYNPLYVIRKGELIQIKADKFPIGFDGGKEKRKFTNHKIKLEKNDCIYIFSDGYADQFGGPKAKKFMIGNFRQLLVKANKYPIEQQKNILNNTIEKWRGELEQVDDILVMGVQV